MSFGKRKVDQPRWLEEGEIDQVLAERGLDKPNKPGLSLFELATGGALVLVAFTGTFFMSDSLFLSGGKSGPIVYTDPEPIARTYSRKGILPKRIGGISNMKLFMVVEREGFDPIDSELHERCMKQADEVSARLAEMRGQTSIHPKAGAEFLACSMKIYIERFCKPLYRNRLAERLKEFVRAKRRNLARVDIILDSRKAGRIRLLGSADERKMLDDAMAYRDAPFVPKQLGVQISKLSAGGFLTTADFGWIANAVPLPVSEYMVESKIDPCS